MEAWSIAMSCGSTGLGSSWEPPSVQVRNQVSCSRVSVDPGATSSCVSVLLLELESSEAAVGSVAACALARWDERCWRLASCWSRHSTRTGLLPMVIKWADPSHCHKTSQVRRERTSM